MTAIYKRELKSYFSTFQAYLYLALFVSVTGLFFTAICINFGLNDFVNYALSNSYFLIFVYCIDLPILTMRLFAEEKKNRTDQLLLTAPVSAWEIVLGKFLASTTIFLTGILIITIFPIIIAFNGYLPITNTISGYIGIILFSLCMIAVGTFISSVVSEPILAVIISAVIGIFVLLYSNLVSLLPDGVIATAVFLGLIAIGIAVFLYIDTKKLGVAVIALILCGGLITALYFLNKEWFMYGLTNSLNWISLEKRFEEFLNGILNLSTIVYMLSFMALFLIAAVQVIERRRWR